jgi:putative endonuclease
VSPGPVIIRRVGARDRVWREGEWAAWEAYRRRGYRLVARNWRSTIGELDLVVARRGMVVFVEVKARTSSLLGGPFDAVTPSKRRRIRRLAEIFLAAEEPAEGRYRFDVASVTVPGRGPPRVHLFEDAF